jgi:hypothetical protein
MSTFTATTHYHTCWKEAVLISSPSTSYQPTRDSHLYRSGEVLGGRIVRMSHDK